MWASAPTEVCCGRHRPAKMLRRGGACPRPRGAKKAAPKGGGGRGRAGEEKNDTGKLNTTFFMRRDYDADAQPNASGAQYNFKIKDADKWTKVVVYYDMGQVVNAISSKKSNPDMEVSDTDDDAAILKDCYVAILGQNKGGVVEISDGTLKKK